MAPSSSSSGNIRGLAAFWIVARSADGGAPKLSDAFGPDGGSSIVYFSARLAFLRRDIERARSKDPSWHVWTCAGWVEGASEADPSGK